MISFNSGSIELYKSFFSNLFSVIVVEFRGTFCQKQAVSKKKKERFGSAILKMLKWCILTSQKFLLLPVLFR